MLRDYQKDICSRVREALEAHRSVMVQMPTGTGKTLVLASLVNLLDNACVLIVAHRKELIGQINDTIQRMGIERGKIIVESIQTIYRRIDSLCFTPSLIVIDEAHHALAKTYRMMWEAWPKARFLGLTATPWRMSGEGFTDLFDVLVQSDGIKRFIADGWLCPYDYYSVRPDSEDQKRVDSLTKRGSDGDYQIKEMREKLDDMPCIERLFETYKKHATGKKGIVYAIDIEHAEHIAEYYRLQGVDILALSSKTPKIERKEAVKNFREKGKPEILVSVDLFSEGFDCPDVEFIQIARPTLSLAKYLQMVGRGLRMHKGKVSCTVIDHVGLYRAFGLPSVDRAWDMFFNGMKDAETMVVNSLGCNAGWIPPYMLESKGNEVVKIVSHEGMTSLYKGNNSAGFERKRNSKGKSVWVDNTNGVEFESMPRVLNFSGLELSTADGILFYPRIASRLIDKDNGIHYNLLKMQVGDGILWKKRYISIANPTQIYELVESLPNAMRVFKDEEGTTFLQQDPDHALVAETEVGREEMIRRCNEEWQKILRITEEDGQRSCYAFFEKYPRMVCEETIPGEWLKRVECGDKRLHHQVEGWIDLKSTYVHQHRPEILKRGYVELLLEDGLLYVRNIQNILGNPYHNYEIRADDRLCIIRNKLYMKKHGTQISFDIRKKSEDLTVFMVSNDYSNYLVVNKPGQELKVTYSSEERCHDVEEQNQLAKAEEKEAAIGKIEPYEHMKLWGQRCDKGVVIPAQFRRVKKPVGRFFAFEKYALQWGIMDIQGKVVVEPKYKEVTIFEDGTAELTVYGDRKIRLRISDLR